MAQIIWFFIAVAVLWLWLKGHWFGWLLAFIRMFWIIQITWTSGHNADDPGVAIMRAVGAFAIAGIPCLFWGSLAPSRK
jgi:hypothetical protein